MKTLKRFWFKYLMLTICSLINIPGILSGGRTEWLSIVATIISSFFFGAAHVSMKDTIRTEEEIELLQKARKEAFTEIEKRATSHLREFSPEEWN